MGEKFVYVKDQLITAFEKAIELENTIEDAYSKEEQKIEKFNSLNINLKKKYAEHRLKLLNNEISCDEIINYKLNDWLSAAERDRLAKEQNDRMASMSTDYQF